MKFSTGWILDSVNSELNGFITLTYPTSRLEGVLKSLLLQYIYDLQSSLPDMTDTNSAS